MNLFTLAILLVRASRTLQTLRSETPQRTQNPTLAFSVQPGVEKQSKKKQTNKSVKNVFQRVQLNSAILFLGNLDPRFRTVNRKSKTNFIKIKNIRSLNCFSCFSLYFVLQLVTKTCLKRKSYSEDRKSKFLYEGVNVWPSVSN